MKRGTTNQDLRKLMNELNKTKKDCWIRVAEKLLRPRRQKKPVNILKLEKTTKQGDVIVVPSKIVGNEKMNHKITVAAFAFSQQARKNLEESGCECLTIRQLAGKNPTGKGIRIMV